MEIDSSSYLIDPVLLLGLGVIYSLFVSLSVSIVRSKSSRLLVGEGLGTPRYTQRLALTILDRSSFYLLFCQASKFLIAVSLGIVSFDWWNILRDHGIVGAVPIGFFVFLLLFVLACAQLFKALAFADPEAHLARWSLPVVLLARFFSPVLVPIRSVVRWSLGVVGVRSPDEREITLSTQDISDAVDGVEASPGIDVPAQELLRGVVSITETRVSEVMTPRNDIAYLREEDGLEDAVREFIEAGYSRLLVIGHDLDDVRGMILAKDLIPLVGGAPKDFSIRAIIRRPAFVDGSRLLVDALRQMRQGAAHFAVVLDEHGGVDGVLTLEDCIEVIVGDIFDEHDSPEDERDIRKMKSGDLLVDGGVSLDDINELHGLNFPSGEYDTVAGFVIHTLGRIPTKGDAVRFNGSVVRVEKVDQNRVTLLRIQEAHENALAPAHEVSRAASSEIA